MFKGDASDGPPAVDDDLLDLRDTGVFSDMHSTQACVDSNGKTLCGALDLLPPDVEDPDGDRNGEATVASDPGGFAFFEFKHELYSGDPQDIRLQPGTSIGVYLNITKGSGGGSGGVNEPGFRKYHEIKYEGNASP